MFVVLKVSLVQVGDLLLITGGEIKMACKNQDQDRDCNNGRFFKEQ
jgi:hypothetical protein